MDKDNLPQEVKNISIESDKIVVIAELAEKRIEAIKKIKTLALKLTNESDWIDQNGRPYLQASGAEKVGRMFGVSWRFIDEPQKILEDSGHFSYKVSMEFIFGDSTIEVIGFRSSKDPFFVTRYKLNPDGKKERYELPPSEIDTGDVLKAAISNAIEIGVTKILGIRNLTWEDLSQNGLDISKIRKIEYKEPKKDFLEEPASNKQLLAINTLLTRLGIKDDYERHSKVSEILGKSMVIESFKDLKFHEASKVIEILNNEVSKK
jgi:hypothetical protein